MAELNRSGGPEVPSSNKTLLIAAGVLLLIPVVALLALSARAIGEDDEWQRCSAFLRDSSPTAADELLD